MSSRIIIFIDALLLQRHGFNRTVRLESDATDFTSRTRARIPAAMGAALDVPWKCSTQPSLLLVTVTCKHKNYCDMKESAAFVSRKLE